MIVHYELLDSVTWGLIRFYRNNLCKSEAFSFRKLSSADEFPLSFFLFPHTPYKNLV